MSILTNDIDNYYQPLWGTINIRRMLMKETTIPKDRCCSTEMSRNDSWAELEEHFLNFVPVD